MNDIQQLINKPSQGKKKYYYLKWCDLAIFWFDLNDSVHVNTHKPAKIHPQMYFSYLY